MTGVRGFQEGEGLADSAVPPRPPAGRGRCTCSCTNYLLSHTQLQVKAIYKYGLHLGVHLLKPRPRPHSTDLYTTVGRLSSGCLQTLFCIGKRSSYSRPAAFGYIHVYVTCISLILRPNQPATVCVKILTEEDVVDLAYRLVL